MFSVNKHWFCYSVVKTNKTEKTICFNSQWASGCHININSGRNENGNEFIYSTYHMISCRFTILLWGEIGRQHVKAPLAAAISPYFDLIHPTNPRINVKDSSNPLLFLNSVWVL